MTETTETTVPVTDEQLQDAIGLISEWHEQRGLAFALINSGSINLASRGKPLTIEAMLSHAHEMQKHANAQVIFQQMQAAQAAIAAKEGTLAPEV